MALIEWEESLSTGIERLDEQHRRLIAMINELNDAMESGEGHGVLGRIIDGLVDYTVTHFADEETLMTRAAYPRLVAHKMEHAAFTKKALDLKHRFACDQRILNMEVLTFLRGWLVLHIKGTDLAYSPSIKAMLASKSS